MRKGWLRHARLPAAVLGLLMVIGCQPTTPGKSESSPSFSDGFDGAAILAKAREAYARAADYRDQAKVYLSYRLAGQLIQEQQPWSTIWSRTRGMRANWFNAELQYDGERLRCYVYHIETENLGQQCLMVPAQQGLPLGRLFADALAAYFAGGRAEMPLDPRTLPRSGALITPVIGWLTGDQPWELLTHPDRIARLADGLVEDRACFHIQVWKSGLQSELWIDCQDGLVRQMTLPNEFLEPAVRDSKEVDQVQFFARFHQASCQPIPPHESFAITVPQHARLVQQFISLPEPFPCQKLGQPLPALNLLGLQGGAFQPAQRVGKLSVMMWVADESPAEIVKHLKMIEDYRQSPESLAIDFVFAEDGLAGASHRHALATEWRDSALRSQVAAHVWFDAGAEAARLMEFSGLPAFIVVAPDSTIQYAGRFDDLRWAEKLTAAIQRIENGEQLADEMWQDYQDFIDRFHRKLQLVSAENGQGITPRTTADSTPVRRLWSLTELARPGNIQPHLLAPDRELLVFDGWRTLVRVSCEGEILGRVSPEIPIGEAASVLRQVVANGKPCYALFAVGGRAVFIVDENWRRVASIQSDPASPDRVIDCQFVQERSLDQWELWVAFQNEGLVRFELSGQRIVGIDSAPVESLAARGASVGAIVRGNPIFSTSDDLGAAIRRSLSSPAGPFQRVFCSSFSEPTSPGNEPYWATRSDATGGWQLVIWQQGAERSVIEIGSQVFDTTLEPFAAGPASGGVALADGLGNIHVLRENGESWASVAVGQPLNGVALIEHQGRWLVISATNHELTAWQISP